MKKYSIILIAVTVVCVIVGFVINTKDYSGIKFINTSSEKMKTDTEDFGTSEVKEIKLDLDYNHVSFVSGSKLEVTSIFPEEQLPKVTLEDGVLSITQEHQPVKVFFVRARFNDDEYTTKIVIPEGIVLDNIDVRGKDADVRMDDITGENFTFNVNDGDVEIRNSKFTNVTTNVHDGDITLNGEFVKADIHTGDGDLNINGKYDQIDANTSDGDITVNTESDMSLDNISVHSGEGDVTVNGHKW